jgi:PrtD family type I secretion system ABC transporter
VPHTELRRALAACRGTLGIVLAFGFALNLLVLTSPLYMMQVFDHVFAGRSVETLILLTVIAVFALAVLAVLDTIRGQMLARLGSWLDERLGPAVLEGAIGASMRRPGEASGQGLRDLSTLRSFITGPSMAPLLDLPWAPIFVAALFLLHPVLGFIGVAGAVILTVLAIANEALTKQPLAVANAAARVGHQRTEAALRNAEVIRALGMTAGIVSRWRRDTVEALRTQEAAADWSALLLGISKFVRLAIQTAITGAAAYLMLHQELNSGAMVASSMLLGRALSPVENAIGSWRGIVGARLALKRLQDLLNANPRAEQGMTMPRPTGRVAVERVSFMPPGAEGPTLMSVGFELAPGEALGVLGPSAAGKSTLARLLAGAWLPSAGHVRLDGADMSVWHGADGAKHIGYLPQDIELFAGTVRENIARLGEAPAEAVIQAAQAVGLDEAIRRLPKGYDSEIGDGGLKLSGGQRQRLGLARAIFGNPSLVILDEPNSSLDYEGEEALTRTLHQLKQAGTTVVVIAHRQAVLNHVDKLLVLRGGHVHAFGGRTEVLQRLNQEALASRTAGQIPQKLTAAVSAA